MAKKKVKKPKTIKIMFVKAKPKGKKVEITPMTSWEDYDPPGKHSQRRD